MPRNKSAATDLAHLLDGGPDPIFVLDDRWTIVFCNKALAVWTGLEEDQIIGSRLGYHSPQIGEIDSPGNSTEPSQAVGVLSGLAPPPEALEGRQTTGHVSAMSVEGHLLYRRAVFLPIGSSEGEQEGAGRCLGTIGLIGPEDFSSAQLAELSAQAGQLPSEHTDALHLAVRQFRAEQSRSYDLDRFVGDSPAVSRARDQIVVAAQVRANVFIQGPAGSGRSHAGRAIFSRSRERLQGDLLPLACDLLSAEQLRSTIELATSRAAADTVGTLLLEEVDQLDESAQLILAEMTSAESFRWRIVSTAQRDIVELAQRGKFREDLACRLSTLQICLPQLSDRKEDLPLLAQLFVEEANRASTRQIGGISVETLDLLSLYDWPGEVAELVEVISEAHRMCSGSTIKPGDLPIKFRHMADLLAHPMVEEERIVLDQFMAKIERELICRALEQAGGNKASAARLLGMTRPRLYRRLAQLGLIPESSASDTKTDSVLDDEDEETPDFVAIDDDEDEMMGEE